MLITIATQPFEGQPKWKSYELRIAKDPYEHLKIIIRY